MMGFVIDDPLGPEKAHLGLRLKNLERQRNHYCKFQAILKAKHPYHLQSTWIQDPGRALSLITFMVRKRPVLGFDLQNGTSARSPAQHSNRSNSNINNILLHPPNPVVASSTRRPGNRPLSVCFFPSSTLDRHNKAPGREDNFSGRVFCCVSSLSLPRSSAIIIINRLEFLSTSSGTNGMQQQQQQQRYSIPMLAGRLQIAIGRKQRDTKSPKKFIAPSRLPAVAKILKKPKRNNHQFKKFMSY